MSEQQQQKKKVEGPKREAILDLAKYKDTRIRVKFIGGRSINGVLKGYDQLMNLVLDDVMEQIVDEDKKQTGKERRLGFVIIRGPLLLSIAPMDGSEIISNPFAQEEM